MVVKKSGKKAPAGGHGAAPEGNNSDLAAMRGTLEDYFNSKKAYQTDQMRELNKEVTKHLLTGDGDDNAMVMEKRQDDAEAKGSGRNDHGDASEAMIKGESGDVKEGGDDSELRRRGSASESGNDYEDDYESDTSVTDGAAATDEGVAGMTLGDYLHAKGDGEFPLDVENEEEERDDAKRAAPKPEKLPQKPSATSKKPLPPAVISGMSLDYYLGASSVAANSEDDDYLHADSKSPPRRQKKNGPQKSKPKSLLVALPARQPPPPDYSTHEDFATPFQKRVKKQNKLKQQQQQHIQQGGAVAKSILLGDSHSSSQLLLAKHLPSPSSTTQPKDKKKHGGGAGSQPPLPKLLGSSSSTHSVLRAAHHRDPHSDGDDGDYISGFADDDSADEKLPPLQHAHAGHK